MSDQIDPNELIRQSEQYGLHDIASGIRLIEENKETPLSVLMILATTTLTIGDMPTITPRGKV